MVVVCRLRIAQQTTNALHNPQRWIAVPPLDNPESKYFASVRLLDDPKPKYRVIAPTLYVGMT